MTYCLETDNLKLKVAPATTYTAALSTTHLYNAVGLGSGAPETPCRVIFARKISSITDVIGKPISICSVLPILVLP